ncbi:MAG: hypothetical protein KF911_04405 [Pseudomonadales bacterium]|nr:hypothetical protein [Pseudomonadales bacterium]
MIPQPARALADLAVKLAQSIAPEAGSAYAMANTGLISMLLLAMAQDQDRAVANRVADIEDLKALFAAAAAAHPDAPQAGRRAAFQTGPLPGLRLSELDPWHAEGLAALIELHAWADANDPALSLRIWDFLVSHTERNRFDLPGA